MLKLIKIFVRRKSARGAVTLPVNYAVCNALCVTVTGDSCPQRYNTGENPYEKDLKIYVMDGCCVLHGSLLSVALLALSALLLIIV